MLEITLLPTRKTVEQNLEVSRRSLNRKLDHLGIIRPCRNGIVESEDLEFLMDYHRATVELRWEDHYFKEKILDPGITLNEYLEENPDEKIPHVLPQEFCQKIGVKERQFRRILKDLGIPRPSTGRGFAPDDIQQIEEFRYAIKVLGMAKQDYLIKVVDQGLTLSEYISSLEHTNFGVAS